MAYRQQWLFGFLAFSLTAPLAAAANADPPDPDPVFTEIEEVVVTAQRRPEHIQVVPMSIFAVSAQTIEARGAHDITGLERLVPGLRVDTNSQSAGLSLRIRGFGAFSNAAIDPSVAPYMDGVFVPRPGALLASFLDVQSVEVLRGPQGTLFGRNATAGALSIRTHDPSADRATGSLSVRRSSFESQEVQGIYNRPLSETFALRFAAIGASNGGFVQNRFDGQTYGESSTKAGRISAKWLLSNNLTWILRADHAESTGDGVVASAVDVSTASPGQLASYTARLGGKTPVLAFPPTTTLNQLIKNSRLSDRQNGVTSDLTWQPGGGYTFRLIASARDWANAQSDGDVVFTPKDLLTRDSTFDSSGQSVELQVISPEGALLDGRLDFVAGLYFFKEDYRISEDLNLGSEFCGFVVAVAAPPLVGPCNTRPRINAASNVFDQATTSRAAYLQATFAVSPTLDLTIGARQTEDEKSGRFDQAIINPAAVIMRAPENANLAFSDSQPSWRANLSWRASARVMAFVGYSTGYKSGGLNSAGGAAALGARRVFNSETAQDWSTGIKSILFNRRLLMNVTAFRTELDDFQERSFDGVSFVIRNSGSIRAQGVELEGQAHPTSSIGLDFGLTYLDSIFTDNSLAPGLPACTGAPGSCPLTQDLTGRTPALAPKWQFNFGIQYTSDTFMNGFSAQIRADANYSSRIHSTNDLNPQGFVDEFATVGGRMTIVSPDERWNISLYGQNLTDERYFRTKFPQVLDMVFGVRVPATGHTLMRGYVGTPRTVGLRLAMNF